ncbi:hypothetical protein [Novosphingobium sp.]|uniref:hypothetical protein n=1 Tax=Novosphingobium sp. TaxID=1874826 RepID=UPI00286A3E30|nr:hypothetical protein [Novosphingobium sp.]
MEPPRQTSTTTITNSFVWRASALQGTISSAQSGAATTSTFTYNANNYLTFVNVIGASARLVERAEAWAWSSTRALIASEDEPAATA